MEEEISSYLNINYDSIFMDYSMVKLRHVISNPEKFIQDNSERLNIDLDDVELVSELAEDARERAHAIYTQRRQAYSVKVAEKKLARGQEPVQEKRGILSFLRKKRKGARSLFKREW